MSGFSRASPYFPTFPHLKGGKARFRAFLAHFTMPYFSRNRTKATASAALFGHRRGAQPD
jgi:hypothetical protein